MAVNFKLCKNWLNLILALQEFLSFELLIAMQAKVTSARSFTASLKFIDPRQFGAIWEH